MVNIKHLTEEQRKENLAKNRQKFINKMGIENYRLYSCQHSLKTYYKNKKQKQINNINVNDIFNNPEIKAALIQLIKSI